MSEGHTVIRSENPLEQSSSQQQRGKGLAPPCHWSASLYSYIGARSYAELEMDVTILLQDPKSVLVLPRSCSSELSQHLFIEPPCTSLVSLLGIMI